MTEPLHAPGRGRPADRRPGEGDGEARMDAQVDFEGLVTMMVDADLELLAPQAR